MSRREFIRWGVGTLSARLASCTPDTRGALGVTRLRVPAPAGASGLTGLRLAFVSDLHRSDLVPREEVEGVAASVASLGADAVLIGGDLCTANEGRPERAEEVLEIFAGIDAPDGIFVVEGNHDARAEYLRRHPLKSAEALGIRWLRNDAARIRRSGDALLVAGLGDLSYGRPDPDAALRDHAGEPVLLLTHNPDTLVDAWDVPLRPWLTLSGHLHGGQIRAPVLGALYPNTRYPETFDQGWAVHEGMRAYVSRGTGVVGVPVRLFCPPEVVLVEIT